MSNSKDRVSRALKVSARSIALQVLQDVDVDGAYANISLNQRLRSNRLSSPDAAFATELVSGTLRMQLFYDAVVEQASRRPVSEIDPLTRNILRLGAHQLLELRTGAHAAVNESVELQRAFGKQSATGFVNGVLRSVSRSTKHEWVEQLSYDTSSQDEELALRFSHPEWIIRSLREALAAEGRADELITLLDANNQPAKVHLALLSHETQEAIVTPELDADLGLVSQRGPSPIGYELASGSPATLLRDDNLREVFRVQDQGSQLAALALLAAPTLSNPEKESWLDLCAGPGGKAAILASAAQRRDAMFRANEVSEHRLKLVSQAIGTLNDTVTLACFDGRSDEAFDGERYDRILIDAPCTGLGALRRRPEARHRKSVSDIAALTAIQHDLLEAGQAHLKPGGILAYVTCSPHIAETRSIVDRTLRAHPELVELDAKQIMQAIAREPLDLAGSQLSAQLWPHRNSTDAMFIALLQRKVEA